MRILRILFVWLCLAVGMVFATGCSSSLGNSSAGSASTPVPTPTADPSGYQAILQPKACLAADWPTLQTNNKMGDFLAWQPGAHNLAYLAPTGQSSWYLGTLMLAKAPSYQEPIPLAENVLAAGDLTWSPGGRTLAFLAFRPNENLYTVMTVRADGSGLTDLFPNDAARTDSRTSLKAIVSWKGDTTLQVIASCGEECRNSYDISITDGSAPLLSPTPVEDYQQLNAALTIDRNIKTYQMDAFPKNMTSPNWSPDNKLIAYLDKRGLLWALNIAEKNMFLLDIGLRDVYETQWAADSAALAIRAEDRIFVFDIPCTLAP